MDVGECEHAVLNVLQTPRFKQLTAALDAELFVGNAKQLRKRRPEADLAHYMFISCRNCTATGVEGGARAFTEFPPRTIALCANRLRSKAEVEESLMHELVHAYDFFVRGMNYSDVQELAYSEVRAAREAECYRYPWPFLKDRCIREAAVKNTQSLYPKEARAAVEAVFGQALKDYSPFILPSTEDDAR